MNGDEIVAVTRDDLGRAIHEARGVGGPWSPCPWPYGYNTGSYECECPSMGAHIFDITSKKETE